jgi:hypothetical protein
LLQCVAHEPLMESDVKHPPSMPAGVFPYRKGKDHFPGCGGPPGRRA